MLSIKKAITVSGILNNNFVSLSFSLYFVGLATCMLKYYPLLLDFQNGQSRIIESGELE